VFAHFTSKANLLKIAVDVALVGDDEEVPLHQRPALRRVHEAATAQEVLERFAAAGADVVARGTALAEVVYAAADADPEVAALAVELDRQRLTGTGIIAAPVADRLGVGDDPVAVERIRDTMSSPMSSGSITVSPAAMRRSASRAADRPPSVSAAGRRLLASSRSSRIVHPAASARSPHVTPGAAWRHHRTTRGERRSATAAAADADVRGAGGSLREAHGTWVTCHETTKPIR